jgi:membrane protease YdiL (CAAX protease family)
LTPQSIAQVVGFFFLLCFFQLYKKENIKKLIPSFLSVKEILLVFFLSLFARAYLFVSIFVVLIFIVIFAGQDSMDALVESFSGGTDYQWDLFKDAKLWEYVIGFISIVILAPIMEEVLMRGIIFNKLKTQYSLWLSLLLTNILFMLMHVHPGLYLMTFLLGVMMTLVYIRWNNLAYPILFHMFLNLQPFIYLFLTKK